jgi:hypothetical protein
VPERANAVRRYDVIRRRNNPYLAPSRRIIMAIPQNIEDDLNALDAAITQLQTDQAGVTTTAAALVAAQTAAAAALTLVTTDNQAVTAANTQLLGDVAAWIATATPQSQQEFSGKVAKMVAGWKAKTPVKAKK